jgi:hypothetical protein
VAVAMDEQRRVGAGRPGAAHGWGKHEPAFVQKSQICPQPRRFFLISTQRKRFQ